jgi:hypothetical protein
VPIVLKSGSLNLLETPQPVQGCKGLILQTTQTLVAILDLQLLGALLNIKNI